MGSGAGIRISGVVQTPWIVDDGGAYKAEAIVELEGCQASFDCWFRVRAGGGEPYMAEAFAIAEGSRAVSVFLNELDQENQDVFFELFDNAQGRGPALASHTAKLKKVRHWKIFVAHDMHTDVGYTDHPEDLIHTIYPSYLDEAFRYIDETGDWAPEDRFTYPVEASFMLYGSAILARDADWLQRLKGHLAQGRITFPYDYAHLASEGAGTEEIARQCYPSGRFLRDMFGVEPVKAFTHTDDAGFSWANVDALADAGCKYLSLRFQDANWNYADERLRERNGVTPDGHCPKYPRLFYQRGRMPGNRLLTFDGPPYHFDDFGFREASPETTIELISWNFMKRQADDYPYDAYLLQLTKIRDNFDIEPDVMRNIRALNGRTDRRGRKYAYPQFVNSCVEDFFEYVASKYEGVIPSYQGTLESFWSFGAAQVAHETAINRANHEAVPAAEFFSTVASALVPGTPYPYEDILRAWDDMLLTDEHTWARWYYSADDPQFIWARNKPIEAGRLAEKLIRRALDAIAGRIAASGPAVAVFNHACWDRTDVVRVERSELPGRCELRDMETGAVIPSRELGDGTVAFLASGVPALGYKCFGITPLKGECSIQSSIQAGPGFIENRFFRVTLDDSGSIASILDKRHGMAELVDREAPHAMNQFVYYTSKKDLFVNPVYSEDCVQNAKISFSVGHVLGTLTAEGTARGADAIRRTVVLYDAVDRIDIVNEVEKSEAPPEYKDVCEEGFFTFPFRMKDFEIRHETPNGEIRPHVDADIDRPTDQFYWSNTDFYTVNRWIDIGNGKDYGVTFSALDAPLVQYGGRRTSCWDKDYETDKPWIYSWVYTNLWSTCYPFTQPGRTVFRYSIRAHASPDWRSGRADKAGFEAANGLMAAFVRENPGGALDGRKGQFFSVDKDNVRLTAMKPAEANGEGLILRFQETLGEDTEAAIDPGMLPSGGGARETDIVENDRGNLDTAGNALRFAIPGRGWKTVRLMGGAVPCGVSNVTATTGDSGTAVAWECAMGSVASHFEVFRDIRADFQAGSGNYVATVSRNQYCDRQVTAGLSNRYFYKVREAAMGRKGEASEAAPAMPGVSAAAAPAPPEGLRAESLGNHRVSLSWLRPETNSDGIEGYRVYRDGSRIADVPPSMTSWLDVGLKAGRKYAYAVRSCGGGGGLSQPCETAEAVTAGYPIPGNIAPEAAITASSELNAGCAARNVADGIFGVPDTGEWAPAGGPEPWVKLEWASRRRIGKVHLYGIYDPGERVIFGINADNTINGILTFSDGTFINAGGIRCDGSATEIRFDEKQVKWLKFRIISHNTARPGLAEIEVF